jgi:predicted NUDIX family NTP pyrophosphohydrolase
MKGKQKLSAGILMYRWKHKELQVLLVHPGGPYWANKDAGSWSVPKGEFEAGQDPLENAIREFKEETGQEVSGNFLPLDPLRQKSGKIIYAWIVEGEFDEGNVVSNNFKLEWPPKSGQFKEFPEVDKAGWFTLEEARVKIIPGQTGFLNQLVNKIGAS